MLKQQVRLAKTAGTARYAYNWGLAKWNDLYEQGERCSWPPLSRLWTVERPEWAKEVTRCVQTSAFVHLGGAYKAFFEKRRNHPTFHRKGLNDSFTISIDKGAVRGNRVRIPNVGYVKMAESLRYTDCSIISYVVSRKAGKWCVSIQVELDSDVRTESTSVVGVDIGIKHWAVASDGTVLDRPAQLKHYERCLKRKQRLLARKAKGSANRAKARLAVSKAYQKINNIKLDAIHKFTAVIAKNHGIAVIEDLDVDGMKQSDLKGVRKGIQDSALAEIRRQLMYKCNNFVQVSRWFPSSKTCSHCGSIKADMPLSERIYHCPSCGHILDRDLNAALNLLNEGIRIITLGHKESACGETR